MNPVFGIRPLLSVAALAACLSLIAPSVAQAQDKFLKLTPELMDKLNPGDGLADGSRGSGTAADAGNG